MGNSCYFWELRKRTMGIMKAMNQKALFQAEGATTLKLPSKLNPSPTVYISHRRRSRFKTGITRLRGIFMTRLCAVLI